MDTDQAPPPRFADIEEAAERMGDVLTIEEAAELLQLHPRTVLRMVNEGTIPAWRSGPGAKSSWRIDKRQMLLQMAMRYGNAPARAQAARDLGVDATETVSDSTE